MGTGWYFKTFIAPSDWKGQHVELHFGATFYESRVWLNGKLVGEHEGGYTEYYFDITKSLKNTNFLAAEINNESKVIPSPVRASRPDPMALFMTGGPVEELFGARS
jgi:beta-glucuronidase